MSIAVGIDLGAARAAVGVYLNGQIIVIPTKTGKPYIYSYVAFTESGMLVGEKAKQQLICNPKNTVYDIKRIIGRRFDDPIFQNDRKHLPYETINIDGYPKISITCQGKQLTYDPEEISAIVIHKLKQNAELFLGHQITRAVITVPASFNDSQRQATKDACSIAGLDVLRVLTKPVAAAIAYNLNSNIVNDEIILICGMGYGATDLSMLKITEGKEFEVLTTTGDPHFGGLDYDMMIVNHAIDYFCREKNINIANDELAVKRLKLACEEAKISLSTDEEATIFVENLKDGVDLHLPLTRKEFDELCKPLYDKVNDMLQNVLHESKIDSKNVNGIVLVGGQANIPQLKHVVSKSFGANRLCSSLEPESAVTCGAAVQAALLSGYHDEKIKDMLFFDVTPLSIGIPGHGGEMIIIIKRNSSIPCRTSHVVTTSEDNQSNMVIHVYEGERVLASDNRLLGNLELTDIPPYPMGFPQIEVIFELDSDGILTLSVEHNRFIKNMKTSIQMDKRRLTSNNLDHLQGSKHDFQLNDEEEREKIKHKTALQSYLASIKTAMRSQDTISDRDKLEIHKICNETTEWLRTAYPKSSKDEMLEKRRVVTKSLQPFAAVLNLSMKGGVKYKEYTPTPMKSKESSLDSNKNYSREEYSNEDVSDVKDSSSDGEDTENPSNL